MKIVFVHFGREHIGIEYLSAVLKKEGYEVEIVYDPGLFSLEDNIFYSPFWERLFKRKDLVQQALSKKPDLIAFSIYTTTYQWACGLAKEIKALCDVPIVFGGIHVTLLPKKVISQPFVDYAIVGEAEESFLSLVRFLEGKQELQSVSSLFYKKNGEILENPVNPLVRNLDELPFPDKSLFEGAMCYQDDYVILTSRGCLFSCSYCCESFLNKFYPGRFFRRRSVASVIEELKVMKERYHFRRVMFFDSILFTDKKWLEEMLSAYKKEIGVPFRCLGHVSFFTRDIGVIMKDAGCYSIEFGVQSFNSRVRKEFLNRHEPDDHFKRAFKICDELSLHYDVDLMFGLPGSSLEDYETTLIFLKDFKFINRIKCYYLSYYPKLSIVDKARDLNILKDEDVRAVENGEMGNWFHSDYSKDQQDELYKQGFKKIYRIYPGLPVAVRAYIIRKKLYKIFGYLPCPMIVLFQFLIALGKRDYRFRIYINNYFCHFMSRVFKREKHASKT